jgi:geranylgeranyl pyrophosphate synthase
MARSAEDLADQLIRAGHRIAPLLEELFPPDRKDYLSIPFWHHMRTGGKRIRPALCVLCCEELGGDADKALHFATAVEILHNMLLVHDDLEDGDRIRRDAPTVWVEFGVENAINVGDYMLGRAYSAIQQSPLPGETILRLLEAFTRAFERTCQGQALDMNRRGQEDLTVEQYLDMVRRKTGDYLALGMVGGAIIAGLSEKGVDRIRELGSNMGPAFQVRDDLIDLTQGKGRGGAVGNDIKEGKPSILYAHALSEANEADRARLLEVVRKPRKKTTQEDVREVISIYERLGSLEFARKTAQSLVEDAADTIDRIPVENKEFFRQVARFMAERTA